MYFVAATTMLLLPSLPFSSFPLYLSCREYYHYPLLYFTFCPHWDGIALLWRGVACARERCVCVCVYECNKDQSVSYTLVQRSPYLTSAS